MVPKRSINEKNSLEKKSQLLKHSKVDKYDKHTKKKERKAALLPIAWSTVTATATVTRVPCVSGGEDEGHPGLCDAAVGAVSVFSITERLSLPGPVLQSRAAVQMGGTPPAPSPLPLSLPDPQPHRQPVPQPAALDVTFLNLFLPVK